MSNELKNMSYKINNIFHFDDIDFWLVSGNRVYDTFDYNWKNDIGDGEFIGGHHYVFSYIPENEIWISDLDKEAYSTMVHEYIERLLMKEHKFSYYDAHNVALNVEAIYVQSYRSR